MRIMMLALSAVLATTMQAPTKPPMKMGLWEARSAAPAPSSDGAGKSAARVVRSCYTPENWLTLMGPTAKDACPKTNEVWTKEGYSFDVQCADKPKMASVSIHFDNAETEHGIFDMYATPQGAPMKMHQEFEEHWVSAECGDVSPDSPVLVR